MTTYNNEPHHQDMNEFTSLVDRTCDYSAPSFYGVLRLKINTWKNGRHVGHKMKLLLYISLCELTKQEACSYKYNAFQSRYVVTLYQVDPE
jgi:hypothetical protein